MIVSYMQGYASFVRYPPWFESYHLLCKGRKSGSFDIMWVSVPWFIFQNILLQNLIWKDPRKPTKRPSMKGVLHGGLVRPDIYEGLH